MRFTNPTLRCFPSVTISRWDRGEAAYAAELLNVPAILPIHYGTFPLLTGTPDELRKLTASQDVEIISLEVGETLD